jgi:CheY-like chemotaxis protein
VLHVDDDPNEEFALRRALVRAGLPSFVHAVASAREAVAYLSGAGDYGDRSRFPLPALVVSDLNMEPGMDGLDLLAWIRSRPDLASLGFVLVTASENEADMRRAADLGANLYVVKSIQIAGVVDILRAAYASWVRLTFENRTP